MLWLTALALAGEPESDPFMVGCDTKDRAVVAAYNDALAAYNAGDMKGARAAMDKVLKRSPTCNGALVVGISARIRLVDNDALEMAARAMAAYPKHPEFPAMLAEMAFVAQAFDASLDAALKARALDPSHERAARSAFLAYMRLGRYDDALALASEYPSYDEGGRDCLRIEILVDQDQLAAAEALRANCSGSKSEIADDAIATLNAHSGDKDAELGHAADLGVSSHALSALAQKRIEEKQYTEARDLLERALELEPWNAFVRINLAMAYIYTRQNAKAKQQLQALYEAETWVTQWQTGAISGVLTKGAERDLERALQRAFAELVVLLVEEGDTEEAGVALRKAEARFGRIAPLAAPTVIYAKSTGGAKAGWESLERALGAFPEEAALVHEAGRMAFADAPGMPTAVAEAIATRGDAGDHYNLVAGYSNAKMFSACTSYGTRLAATLFSREDGPGLVYGCALDGPDLAAADGIALAHATALDPEARVYHAHLLVRAGRIDEALAIVATLDRTLTGRADIAVEGLTKLGRLDDALAEAKAATLRPATRYNLGIALYNNQRDDDFSALLSGFDCALLPEVAKDCRELIASVSK